jgi:6-phosphogluconolactonase
VTIAVEVFGTQSFASEAAARVAIGLPGEGSVVLTGGSTARAVYGSLAEANVGWGELDVFFSDERCVPPDDDASNFGMAARVLLEPVGAHRVHRMPGERDPEEAAAGYESELQPVVERGFDLALLGMGADCHVAALFPGSAVVQETARLCVAVDRPDGLRGLTLTPPALLSARAVLLIVAGRAKAEAVERALSGGVPARDCPARIFSEHPNVTFLLDTEAASRLHA